MESPGFVFAEAFETTLEPLEPAHAATMLGIMHEENFEFYTSKPEPYNEDGWRRFIEARHSANSFPHLIRVRGEAVGMSTIFDVDLDNRKLEIGYTMIAQPWRSSQANPASKLMLMTAAFEQWNLFRVQLKGDARNERSMRAMTRLGFVREGTLRNFQLLRGDYHRSATFFSVLPDEWPAVKAGLEAACKARMR